MSSDSTSIDVLTQDLITLILVKLPVKALVCCKSVCKPWLSIISSPNFIISHLNYGFTKPGGPDQTFIVRESDDNSMYLINLDAPPGFPCSRGDYSFEPHYEVVGSCNGIVCVFVSNCQRENRLVDIDRYSRNSSYRNNPNTYLWNPATKQSKLVPLHNIRENLKMLAMGFGFDSVSNDFKVLRVVSSHDQPFSAEVYSANANVWRKVDSGPTDFPNCDEFDVCVNGFLYCEGLYGMTAFDLDKEVFTCGIRPLPPRSFDSTFLDFNGSVAIITSTGYKMNSYNLWMLDDEACLGGSGVEASWTLKLCIDIDCAVDYPLYVYGCFNSGDFLLRAGAGAYLLKNCHTKKARNVPLSKITGRRLIKYNESLVSITGKQVRENAPENDY